MDRWILIPVRGRDRVEEILPYLADLAQAGTKITFLVHLGTWRFRNQLDDLFSLQRDAKGNCAYPDLSAQLRTIRGRPHGVEVELRFYAGSLRSLKQQLMEEHKSVIIMLPPASNRILRWLCKIHYARFFSRPFVSAPVLLCYLGK